MTHTYTAGAQTDKDRIRARLGDTDSAAKTNARLEDEEIEDFIRTEGNYRAACAAAAEALAAKFFRLATGVTVGETSRTYTRRAEGLLDIAKLVRAQAVPVARATAGGISASDKAAVEANSDRVKPSFRRGMLDHP